jgi:GT2 family glycosyltransferase
VTPPRVSVVMPFLNVAPYLAESIESVRAQSYPHWELLLADDGATDGSTEIARSFAALDSRVRWFEHPGHANLGASAARNLALRHATGSYVALLDGDDLWLPRKLEEQVALLEAHPAVDILVGSTEFWYGWTGDSADAARDHVVPIGLPHGSIVSGLEMLRGSIHGTLRSPATCSLIARRAAFARAGGFEESFRVVFTDLVFYAKLFLDATVLVVETCWDRYRRHAASSLSTATRTGAHAEARLRYLRWLRRHLEAHGVDAPDVYETVDAAIFRLAHPHADRVRTQLRHHLVPRARNAVSLVVRRVLRAVGRA